MSLHSQFVRVSRRRRCPICNQGDWCLLSRKGGEDPVQAICPRIESPTRFGEAGWLHQLREGPTERRDRGIELPSVPKDHRLAAERLACSANLGPIAAALGLPSGVLQRLLVGTGCDAYGPFSSWPQFDPHLRVVGISLRRGNGSKHLRSGDRSGLHVPLDLPLSLSGERVLVVEGGSDCAAGLALGLWSIGRHSVLSCFGEIVRLLRSRRPACITVVADRDPDERGLRASQRLAARLRPICPQVGVVLPPPGIKDLRAWTTAGASLADVLRGEEVLP